jgi:hypothetical protein
MRKALLFLLNLPTEYVLRVMKKLKAERENRQRRSQKVIKFCG